MQERTLGELAEYVDGRVCGDPKVIIKSASTLGRADEGDISFLTKRKYEKQLRPTTASAVMHRVRKRCRVVISIKSVHPIKAYFVS